MQAETMKNIYITQLSPMPIFNVVQGDTGRIIALKIMDVEVPSTSIVHIFVKKPSGAEVMVDGSVNADADGHTILRFAMGDGSFEEIGVYRAQVIIVQGSSVIATFKLIINAESNLLEDSDIQGSSSYQALVSNLQKIQNVIDKVAELDRILAEGGINEMVAFELESLRTDNQGVTFDDAGKAVRAMIDNITEDLEEIKSTIPKIDGVSGIDVDDEGYLVITDPSINNLIEGDQHIPVTAAVLPSAVDIGIKKLVSSQQITPGSVLKVNEQGLAEWGSVFPQNAGAHKSVFRGKFLGNILTEDQRAHIFDGTFEDMFVGDYWIDQETDTRWVIVDIDYWLGTGNTDMLEDHHLVVMPDKPLYTARMHGSAMTDDGYGQSDLKTEYLPSITHLASTTNVFGYSFVSHSEPFVVEVLNGTPYTTEWIDTYADVPSEVMIFGHSALGTSNEFVTNPKTTSNTQFAIFRFDHSFINCGQRYWLRDEVGDSDFACVEADGTCGHASATNAGYGVRPVLCIG